MTNYQQTGKFVFEMKNINTKYHLNKRVKKVGNINSTDIKHGVTNDQVLAFLDKIKNDPSYADKQNNDGRERLESLEKHFTASPLLPTYLQYLVHYSCYDSPAMHHVPERVPAEQ